MIAVLSELALGTYLSLQIAGSFFVYSMMMLGIQMFMASH